MPKYDLRFTITAGSQESVFLSVSETSVEKKIRLFLKAGQNRNMETGPGTEIVEDRFIIHDSPLSSNYSTVHYSQISKDKRKQDVSQLTDAIKKKSGFAMLYGMATANLSNPFYARKPNDKSKIANIDTYDPKKFIFCYAVAIGAAGASFSVIAKEPVNIRQENFHRYTLVLFWSYVPFLSAPFSSFVHVMTLPPESAKTKDEVEELRKLMTGASPAECVDAYFQMRRNLMDVHLQKSRSLGLISESDLRMMQFFYSHHLQVGTTDNPIYRRFFEWAAPRGWLAAAIVPKIG
jgi:hypothetical protein